MIYKDFFVWSIEFLLLPPELFVTLAVALNLLASAIYSSWPNRKKVGLRSEWALTQFLFPPVLLAVAKLTAWTDPFDPGMYDFLVVKALIIVWGLTLIALCVGLYWVRRLKGHRWFAISVLISQLWWMQGAGFIAGMAITGDWI